MTNGSSHWILCQPDLVSKSETMARGTEVLFAASSDCLSNHPTKDEKATDTDWGSLVLMTGEAITGCANGTLVPWPWFQFY